MVDNNSTPVRYYFGIRSRENDTVEYFSAAHSPSSAKRMNLMLLSEIAWADYGNGNITMIKSRYSRLTNTFLTLEELEDFVVIKLKSTPA